MGKKIIITGATGLTGKRLIPFLMERSYAITIFTRNIESAKRNLKNEALKYVKWDYTKPAEYIIEHINGCEIILNFAGASIGDRRWNEEYKKILYDSRVMTTKKIVEAISKCNEKPKVLVSSSAIGYYGTTGEETLTEESPGSDDFMATLCKDWEKEAMEADKYDVRVITLRTGIVLDKREGALKRFITPFKFFAGGYQGTGKQWISWIHIEDYTKLILFAIDNEIKGAINCTTMNPVTNKEFARALGKVLKRPAFFPVPGFILKIVIGEFAEYILKGRKVIPQKALNIGFKFQFEEIEKALNNLLNK